MARNSVVPGDGGREDDGFDLSPPDETSARFWQWMIVLLTAKSLNVCSKSHVVKFCGAVTAVDSGIRALQFLGLDEEKSSSVGFDGLKVDLIITDYCMPGMTGYELLKKIKESSTFREIPVVIMSSENVMARIDRCLEEGAEDFIVKPVKLSDNFETFYPFPVQFPSPAPSPTNPNSSFLSPGKVPSPQPSAPPPQISTPLLEPKASHTAVAKAVAVTAVSTFVIAALLFFFIQRYAVAQSRTKRIDTISGEGHPPPPVLNDDHFSQVDGSLKDVIVDENGLDVLYWRKLEEESKNGNSQQEEEDDDDDDETVQANSEPIQEIPLLRGKSSVLQNNKAVPEIGSPDRIMAPYINPQSEMTMRGIEKSNLTSQTSNLSHLPPPPSAGPPLPTPPPPPPFSTKENKTPPPPPPPKAVVLATSSKLPPVAKGMASKDKPGKSSAGEGREGNGNGQVKLKPLHWDKVNKNTDHSMVWDKIGGGSFRFDDDLMEALFGYVATNRRSPKKGDTSDLKNQNGSPPAQIAILDVRKSQNIAIVLKSLGISREKILDGLTDGQGLNGETLEKLMRIAPTKDEESQIEFDGDPSRLADAEFFPLPSLKAVPSAFTRLNAMLFRLIMIQRSPVQGFFANT
ncbi:hypothetical protein GH714_036404 [Hevea brasiliensis]|uniref:Response regulatory domain-containing protein n=1 Tax=Hevea brasiliensis TaxID=3981 RepID=A0A6A6LQQ7_HEVBR|nr:hypothetical protein GH714_036404 [Hevea brasiliensis]